MLVAVFFVPVYVDIKMIIFASIFNNFFFTFRLNLVFLYFMAKKFLVKYDIIHVHRKITRIILKNLKERYDNKILTVGCTATVTTEFGTIRRLMS